MSSTSQHIPDREAQLNAWVDAAPEAERADRYSAAARIREARANPAITEMSFADTPSLSSLPPGLPDGLTILDLSDCTRLTALPTLPDSLSELILNRCVSLTHIENLPRELSFLFISGANALTTLPTLPERLTNLYLYDCAALERLPSIPANLAKLEISICPALTRLPDLPEGLYSLNIRNLHGLTRLPDLPQSLHSLNLRNCAALANLPAFPANMNELSIWGIPGLTQLSTLPDALTNLDIRDCLALERLPALPAGLTELTLDNNQRLASLPDLPQGLNQLTLSSSTQLRELPALPPELTSLDLSDCNEMRIPALPDSLTHLDLSGCDWLAELPALPDSLIQLDLTDCGELARLPATPPPGLEILSLSGCAELTEVPAWVQGLDDVVLPHHLVMAQPPHEYWYQQAGKNEQDLARLRTDWERIQNTPGIEHFKTLLTRLVELGEFQGQRLTPAQVVTVIEEALQAPEAHREIIFKAVEDAGGNCLDRPLLRFNEIRALAQASQLLRTGANAAAHFDLVAGLFRQALLDSVVPALIVRQWEQGRRSGNEAGNGPNMAEALEVQLALRERLSTELALPFAVRGLHTELAALNQSDLTFARDQVNQAFAEEGRLTRGLVAQPAWQWYLEQLPGMSTALDTLTNTYAERMFALYEQRQSFSDEQTYLTQTEQLSSERQAAIERLLSQKTDETLAPYKRAVTAHLHDFIEGNASTIGHRDRVASLRDKVARYLTNNPRTDQKPALTKLADQLTGRLQTLQNATEMSLARQIQLVETLIQPNGGLPTLEDLTRHSTESNKRRKLPEGYLSILDDLDSLHANRLPRPDAQPDVAPGHERLLSWDAVRARVAPAFSRQGQRLGARVRHAPQAIWLDSDPAGTRRGRCSGLALAWALGPGSPALLDTLFTVAAQPADPSSQRFRQDIDQLHQAANRSEASTLLPNINNWDQAITHLAAQNGTRALLVHAGNHSVALTAQGSGEQMRFAFFDPNAGVWSEISDATRLRQALVGHFTPELCRQYDFDGRLKVESIQPPAAGSPLISTWQSVRSPLHDTAGQLMRQDMEQGPLYIGGQRITRQELHRLGATVNGRPIRADTDWSNPKITLPLTRGQRALWASGTGMRLYGAYHTLSGALDNFRQGRRGDAAIDLGGFAAEFAGEGVERGATRLGEFLQKTLARTAASTTSAGQALGRWLARGAGIAGNLLTLPFDLYTAITQFSQANTLRGDARQNALFQGGMATLGALTGLGLGIAAAAGASASLLGPLGLAFGAAMLAADQIYAAVKQVQEIQQWIRLSTGEQLVLGLRTGVGMQPDLDTQRRVEHARYEAQWQREAQQMLDRDVSQSIAVMLYPELDTGARQLNDTCTGQHAHEHLALGDTEPPAPRVANTQEGPVSLGPAPLPLPVCPLHPEHRHPRRYGYEVFINATDDRVDFSRATLAADSPTRILRAGPQGGNGPLIGHAGNDLFTLKTVFDRQIEEQRELLYRFDGAGGNDSLLIETDFNATDYQGHFIDLETGTLALKHSNGTLPPIGAVSGIQNLIARPGASRHLFYGDAKDNLLVGGNEDRLYGRAGDDTFSLSGRAYADGGAGRDLYLIDKLKAGDQVTLEDSGSEDEPNQIYLSVNADQVRRARIEGQALVLSFASGATLRILGYNAARSQRWQLLTQDGQSPLFDPPASSSDNQDIGMTWRAQPERLLALLAAPGVQTLARVTREQEKTVMFNFGNGDDTLVGDSARKNLFVLGSGSKTVTGGARDDMLTLNAAPRVAASGIADYDSASRQAMARGIDQYRYLLDGGAGKDTLQLETGMTDSGFSGYRIDLAQHSIALLTHAGNPTQLGGIRNIENLVAPGGAQEADSRHELLGDDQANLLVGAGHDRLEGREGDDILRVSGQARAYGGDGADTLSLTDNAFADGGAGRDIYLIDAVKTDDHPDIQDSVADGNDNVVRLSDSVRQIRDWQVVQHDLVLSFTSGGTLTIKGVYQDRTLVSSNWRFITRDGWILSPELPTGRLDGPDSRAWRIAAAWLSSADADASGTKQGIDLNLATRTLAQRPEAPTPREPMVLDARYRLIGDGTAYDDTLSGAAENFVLRGRAGDDTLIAAHPGGLMRGDEGADRYQIDLSAAADEKNREAWYLDNQSGDGRIDTLSIRTRQAQARLQLARVQDDLWIGSSTEPDARVVVLNYYLQAESRHLAVELTTRDGHTTARHSASALEQMALSRRTPVSASAPGDAARIEQLIQVMAGFDATQGSASTPMTQQAHAPAILLASAA